uniref:Uncharacterized protein n=1 Tax=Ciona intestinalis TaxID=7719 RepID=H2XL47_CIOIN
MKVVFSEIGNAKQHTKQERTRVRCTTTTFMTTDHDSKKRKKALLIFFNPTVFFNKVGNNFTHGNVRYELI